MRARTVSKSTKRARLVRSSSDYAWSRMQEKVNTSTFEEMCMKFPVAKFGQS